MQCPRCGSEYGSEHGSGHKSAAHFCSRCGGPLPPVPPAPPPPIGAYATAGYRPLYPAGAAMAYVDKAGEQRLRLQSNLQPLGITWLLFGAYRLLFVLVAWFAMQRLEYGGFLTHASAFAGGLVGTLFPVIEIVSLAAAALALVTGYGLLTRQSWGRVLGIVAGTISLIKLPVGTGVGIYSLWVLAPQAAGYEWNAICREP